MSAVRGMGKGTGMRRWVVGAAIVLACAAPTAVRAAQLLDDFEDVSGWSAQASPGASLEIAQDAGRTGNAMRLDFDFHGGGGFVIAISRNATFFGDVGCFCPHAYSRRDFFTTTCCQSFWKT